MTLYLPPWFDFFALVLIFGMFRMWGRGIALHLNLYDNQPQKKGK